MALCNMMIVFLVYMNSTRHSSASRTPLQEKTHEPQTKSCKSSSSDYVHLYALISTLSCVCVCACVCVLSGRYCISTRVYMCMYETVAIFDQFFPCLLFYPQQLCIIQKNVHVQERLGIRSRSLLQGLYP